MVLEGRKSSQPIHPGVRIEKFTALALIHRVPLADRTYQGTFPGDSAEATTKFGPLKVALETIPAIYAHCEVRQLSPSQNSPDKSILNRDSSL